MPSLSSLFNNKQDLSCSACGCHLTNDQETSSILSPTRWFPRIRRRSSSSSSTSSTSSLTMSLLYEKTPTEYNAIQDNKHISQFQEAYQLAVEEIAYAVESQGSIYYNGDLLTATEAVDNFLDQFQNIMQTLDADRSHQFQQGWTDTLFELRSRLDSLPFAADS